MASDLDWSEIDPSILGTLFERGLDPGKRAQLGAHYTDRDKIMLLVEPVVIRPWLAEWDAAKAEIAGALDRVEAAKSPAASTKRLNAAERRYRAFLNRLRVLTVLDPACGSGNFLYLALQALKDLEHLVQLDRGGSVGRPAGVSRHRPGQREGPRGRGRHGDARRRQSVGPVARRGRGLAQPRPGHLHAADGPRRGGRQHPDGAAPLRGL